MEAENGKKKAIYFRTNHSETPRSRSAAWTGKNGERIVLISEDFRTNLLPLAERI